MKPIFLFTLAVCLHLGIRSHAQVHMEAIGIEEGLSQGFVTSMIQDKRGFMWFGTYDGLNRYDGYNIRRFTTKPFDPWSLHASFITQLYEDERQLLWVGTHQGLEVFDPFTERFYKLSLPEHQLPANQVNKIVVDRSGNVFVHILFDSISTGLFLLRIPADFAARLRQQGDPLKGILAEQVKAPPQIYPPCNLIACLGDTMPLLSDQKGSLFGYSQTSQRLQQIDLHKLPGAQTIEHNVLWGKYKGYFFRWKLPNGRDTVSPPNLSHLIFPIQDSTLGIWFYPHGPFYRKNNSAPIEFDISRGKDQMLTDPAFLQAFSKLVEADGLWNDIAMVDRRGAIWIGTGGLGVRKVNPRQLAFGNLLSGNSISSMRELPDGRIWVRLYTEESIIVNPVTGQKATPPWKHKAWLNEVFLDSKGDYWLIETNIPPYTQKRLLKYETKTGRLTRFSVTLPFLNGVTEKILEDQSGNVWVAANQGNLFRCRSNSIEPEHFSFAALTGQDPLNLRVTALNQDNMGTLWVGTNRGLLRVIDANTNSPHFSFFKHDPDNPQSLSIDWISCICPDPVNQNILWLGTRGGGLNCLNIPNLSFSFISETPNGLPDNVVYGILPDDHGNLWCSTNRGLCRFNPLRNTFVTYRESDGLLSTEFNTGSYMRTRDGRFWFGGVNGLNMFRPEDIHANSLPPDIAITGIKVRGAARLPDMEGRLSLSFEDNNVLFEFAAFDFTNSGSNRFRHRLIGIDQDWVYDGTSHSANYAALPPGEYVLELQGATSDSPWSTQSVVFNLTIHPPWYRSGLAYFAYFFALLLAVGGVIRYREKIFRLEQSAAINERESSRLKEFEGVKNQFFANVAHELRTPLTVILGLAKRLHRAAPEAVIDEYSHNIIEQGNTLLHLTNQILDLAKLESHQFTLSLSNGNISRFVQQHAQTLAPLAESKALKLMVRNELPVVWMDFYPIQIQKILNNLIANAIRHSQAGGIVRITTALEQDDTWLKLIVEDEGEGIAPNDLPHIFDRFYQGSQSNTANTSGLGLTLTRDLVRLMGGAVQVESTLGKGTLFTIFLPISNLAPRQLDAAENLTIQNERKTAQLPTDNQHLPLLLILEDNDAVANFLQRCLQDYFRLEMASDGEIGIAKALELIPDLILTDVAMPKKDGFEVASSLKNDVRTSHIPIVMLTAKVEQRDRLEGQRRGANAYLTKPFEEDELLQVLHNLLHLQQQWKRRYAGFAPGKEVSSETELATEDLQLEDAFMQTLYAAFEANYADDSFNLDRLCRLLGMSSSQLDRKLKVLSNQTPMQMLRSFRLQKAKALLQARPKPSIKDVCFRTGFKSPSHFSRAFSEAFGKPPSEV